MEFFIDKKCWNLVIKKVTPRDAVYIKKMLTEWHYEVKPFYKKVKDKYAPTGYRRKREYKNTKIDKYLKKDFALKLSHKSIKSGFFLKKCFQCKPRKVRDNYFDIEKAIIKTLIEFQGMNESVLLDGERVIPIEENKHSEIENKGFVYLIRNDDIYKIGITDNLLRRFNQLKPDEVLNVVRCSNYEKLEKELHKKFKKNRIPQSEYFRLDKNQIEQVNDEMVKGADF